ncbi:MULTISPECIES: deoxynucleoside kinase [Desulfitobacterium]|uniref:Thymidylate kinase n=1 Tax=Desulfitobacterium dehalogenans (strain ATCC 51507 / DSM 9161 / JW/IU-DC1) TaxID=756499 RepID=I4AA29_DESDJ|nr:MULTISPECIES: deoxynucleoside kinase [Desulfitobacterium]AFM00814.1 thymidylate kinase [Desulfitobacterium dehalogenans ATCC 51507]
MGKLIIIEGGDGSGKATQTRKLWQRLTDEGLQVKKVEFPNYSSPSSSLVTMYLGGEFGTDPNAVNPYAASTFYAVDRYASYKTLWGDFYSRGGVILSDRYTTSNMIHQAVKIKDSDGWESYIDWLKEFEYHLMGLPEPDMVIYLNMPPDLSIHFIANRKDKSSVTHQDIHEKNRNYLNESYENAQKIRIRENWITINCVTEGRLKTIDEIHEEIYEVAKTILSD